MKSTTLQLKRRLLSVFPILMVAYIFALSASCNKDDNNPPDVNPVEKNQGKYTFAGETVEFYDASWSIYIATNFVIVFNDDKNEKILKFRFTGNEVPTQLPVGTFKLNEIVNGIKLYGGEVNNHNFTDAIITISKSENKYDCMFSFKVAAESGIGQYKGTIAGP